MYKFKHLFLMGCLLFSVSFSHANSTMVTKNDGTPIEIIGKTCHSKPERGNSIIPTLNGHLLTVVFSENLGQVTVEVTTASGTPVDGTSTITPNGIQIYIPNAGDYIVNFTLPDGDEYYGEFTVTD
jgi:hypothetical protein